MTIKDNKFLIWQGLTYLLVILALIILPGAPVISTAVALGVVWCFTLFAYNRCIPWSSDTGRYALLAVWGLLSLGIIANIHLYTTVLGGTVTDPVLLNPDCHRWFLLGNDIADGNPHPSNFFPIDTFFGFIFMIAGRTVVAPFVVSMLSILLSLVALSFVIGCLEERDLGTSPSRASATGIILISTVCFFLALGTVLLKDASIILAISLIACGMMPLLRPSAVKRKAWLMVAFVAGVALLMLLRGPYLWFVALGIIICCPFNRDGLKLAAIMLAIVALAYGVYLYLRSAADINAPFMQYLNHTITDSYVDSDADHSFYNTTLADSYMSVYPLWKKILLLPVVCGVQFLVPFFWTMARDMDFGYTFSYAHIGIPWYIVGGMILYFILFKLRSVSAPFIRLTLWGAVIWVGVAFVTAGAVTRYSIPALPLLIPGAVAVWYRFRKEHSFKLFASIYIVAVTVALVLAYNLQNLGQNP